ncbi:MAG: hypothetical protein ACT4OP_12470 [Actinomycetota bacterium]
MTDPGRRRGRPTSSNGASSFHLHWIPRIELLEVAVTVTLAIAPKVDDLYFWALQASFADDDGITGGAHLGLQWNRNHPGGTAVNWGGYDRSGSILEGTESSLLSATSNANTRDYGWQPGRAYRLRIGAERPGWWAGEITDLGAGETRQVRSLRSLGDRLILAMVWSEVFARCDAPPVAVVWSDPWGLDPRGEVWSPQGFSVTYQRVTDGGCSNTDVRVLPHGVGQFTNITRLTPQGTTLPLSSG